MTNLFTTQKAFYIKSLSILTLMISFTGCGSSKQQAMLDTIHSPQRRPATFEALQDDFRSAERDRVHLISPAKYLEAKKLYNKALEKKSEGKPEDDFIDYLKESRAYLDNAIAISKQNRDVMAPLLASRQVALSSGAAETTNKDLKKLEEKYLNLVKHLDRPSSREDAVEEITELSNDYKALTIKTLQAKFLGEARNNLDIARAEGADKLVPKTLKSTEDIVQKAEDFITQNVNPPALQAITQLGNEATVASRRLLTLTRQTKDSKDLSPEDRSLRTEAMAHSADEESARLQSNLAGSQKKITDLETKTKDFAKLEQRDEKNKTFETVRNLFDEEEAKVTRQGNSLVISLKKINFASNKSEIPSASFELLKKVQTAIHSFKEPSITVEGHTDSIGEAGLNKSLSEKRAEAVKAYFLSNNVMPPEKVEAIGFGSDKPLASNKFSEGRSINRRIDIVIKD